VVWNNNYAAAMFAAFPPELREMIYESLIAIYDPILLDREGCDSLRTGIRENNPCSLVQVHHFFNSKFMGIEFVTELSKTLYRKATFHVNRQADVARSLYFDILASGCMPLDRIRRIHVTLTLDSYNAATRLTANTNVRRHVKATKADYLTAVAGLDPLLQLERTCETQLGIIVDAITKKEAQKFAEVLFPFVYQMEDQGWEVTVIFEPYEDLEFDYGLEREGWEEAVARSSHFDA
jgi:hypothetical protein